MNYDFIKYCKDNKLLMALILSFIYVAPLIIANYYYIDDVSRSVGGYARWIDNGRPLTEYLILSMGLGNVIDIFPIPLILSPVVIVASCFYLCYKLQIGTGYSALIISIAVLCNPFYIQNLSYRFDSFTMSLSLSCAIVAATLAINKDVIKSLLLSSILIVALMSLYQPSVNAYISFTCAICVLRSTKITLRDSLYFLTKNVIALLIGVILYKVLIAEVYVSGGYSIAHSETLALTRDSLPLLKKNYESFMYVFESTFSGLLGWLFFSAMIIPFLRYMISPWLTVEKMSIKAIKMLLVILSIMLMVFCIFGLMLSLKKPIFYPRVFIGFSGFMLLIASGYLGALKNRAILIPSILIATLFIQMAAYGNSLSSQKEKEEFLFSSMAKDIIDEGHGVRSIRFNGRTSMSPTANIINRSFGIMGHIVPSYIRPDWMFGAFYFGRLGVNVTYAGGINLERTVSEGCRNPIKRTSLYYILQSDDTIIFDFNKCEN